MKRLEALKSHLAANKFDKELIISELKELREEYKGIKRPLMVKTCRLIYEYLEQNEAFDVDVFEERGEDDQTSLAYLFELMTQPDNEYNIEEIREYVQLLKDELD